MTQSVRPGFWDDGAAKAERAVDRELQAAMDGLHRRIDTWA